MTVMRSVLYVPSHVEKMVDKAPSTKCDVLTLDLEDAVPPAEKPKGRESIKKYLAGERKNQLAPSLYVRINNWETFLTNDDLEAIVWPGLDGVCLAKTGHPDHVKRLDYKLEELERLRKIPVGTVKIQMLIETAQGMIHAYESATASPRCNSLIFGAVDYCKDMRVTLTDEGYEQTYGRFYTAVAARAAGCVAIDCPFVNFADVEAFKVSVNQGIQMGYEGRMLIHPSQIEPSNELYTPSPARVKWAEAIKKVFEEEGLAKGKAAVAYTTPEGKNNMVDTPVYENALQILRTMEEIKTAEKKAAK